MNALDDSLAQYLTPRNGVDAENAIPPPKTPHYHPNDVNLDLEMSDQNEESYEEQSPPPSQPRPARNNQSPPNRQQERESTWIIIPWRLK